MNNDTSKPVRTLEDIAAEIAVAEKAVAAAEAAQEEKSRRGIRVHHTNPFIAQAAANTNEGQRRKSLKGKDGTELMLTTPTGDFVCAAGFWQYQEVDRTQFVKIFANGMKGFAGLSPAGVKVFELLCFEVQRAIGKDEVYLSFSGIDLSVGLTQSTFTRGIRNLLDKKFIAATKRVSWYFINPDYIFNGDRLALVKEFRIKNDAQSDANFRNQRV